MLSFYHIYTALEDALTECSNDEILKEIYYPIELFRRDSILQDIKFFCNSLAKNIDEELSIMSPATKIFVDRINECKYLDPKLLVGFSYSRYLGDLSGGQIMSRRIAKMYNLDESCQGISFYQFPNLGMSIDSFKKLYRGKLNFLQITDTDTIDSIISEAVLSFSMTINIYKELDEILQKKQKAKSDYLKLTYGGSIVAVTLAIGVFFTCIILKKR